MTLMNNTLPDFRSIHVAELLESEDNPRFTLDDIDDLAASIKVHGIIEPLVLEPYGVTSSGAEGFKIIAGHRRAAAAKLAGLKVVPAIIRNVRGETPIIHLVENIQRVDLKPLEIALSVAQLIESKMKPKDIAKQVGRSPAWVSKFSTIGKAWAKLEKKTEGSGSALMAYTDADKLYDCCRALKVDQDFEVLRAEN